MSARGRAAAGILAVGLLAASQAPAFECLKTNNVCLHWADGQATIRSFLGSPGGTLLNGTISWDQNAVAAANDWNAAGAAFRFDVVIGGSFSEPCGRGANHACPNTGPAGDNPVLFRETFCGMGFGDVIQLTNYCADARSGAMINAPVFVNRTVPWNAYDGPLLFPVNDIRRVLLHEFGHVLGLDHTDRLPAIMNTRASDIDHLQPDDVAGIRAIYPHRGVAASGDGCQLAAAAGTATRPHWMLGAAIALVFRRWWRSRAARAAYRQRRCPPAAAPPTLAQPALPLGSR